MVGKLLGRCDITLAGIMIRKNVHANKKIKNQGFGLSCGISLRVVGSHQFLA